jgi:hypothetical protein
VPKGVTVIPDELAPSLQSDRGVLRKEITLMRLTGDLALPGLLVKTLGVSGLDNLKGSVDEDLDERDGGLCVLVQWAGKVTVGLVRRDESGHSQRARLREKKGDLADTANLGCLVSGILNESTYVLDPRGLVEAKVLKQSALTIPTRFTHLVETETDVVAVKTEGVQLLGKKVLLKSSSNGRLPRVSVA